MNLGLKNEAVAVTGCLLHIKDQAAGVLLMQAAAAGRRQAHGHRPSPPPLLCLLRPVAVSWPGRHVIAVEPVLERNSRRQFGPEPGDLERTIPYLA